MRKAGLALAIILTAAISDAHAQIYTGPPVMGGGGTYVGAPTWRDNNWREGYTSEWRGGDWRENRATNGWRANTWRDERSGNENWRPSQRDESANNTFRPGLKGSNTTAKEEGTASPYDCQVTQRWGNRFSCPASK